MLTESSQKFRPLTMQDAIRILGWRYLPPFDFYNHEDVSTAAANELLCPDFGYRAICGVEGRLEGYFCLGKDGQVPGWDYDSEFVDLGMGLRLDLTGIGLGRRLLAEILAWTDARKTPLRATVAAWNTRAIRLCERAGFSELASFEGAKGNVFKVFIRVPPV